MAMNVRGIRSVSVMVMMAAMAAAGCGGTGIALAQVNPHNTLSPAERAAGWVSLLDGVSPGESWRGYRRDSFPTSGWTVEDGALKVVAGGGGGDIITNEQYGDFEFAFEFRVAPQANSGVMYRVTEQHGASWQTGPEFQVLDDQGHKLEPNDLHSSGAMYDLFAPAADKVMRPTGEYNSARIRIKDGVIQHFLNGRLVVTADMESDAWRERIAGSKFNAYDGFGVQPRGHIALQDHGNDVWYRNLRIRDLDLNAPPTPGEANLLEGGRLDQWTWFSESETPIDEVWSIDDDGVLICRGEPSGYLKTKAMPENYVLKLEWRWSPETKEAGNSGVLLRQFGPDKVWPACVEAQLHSGSAGDFINIGDPAFEADPARSQGRRVNAFARGLERPIGEWNEYEIIVDGERIRLFVNGQLANECVKATERPGHIAIQSEGTEIHFRDIRLTPIN